MPVQIRLKAATSAPASALDARAAVAAEDHDRALGLQRAPGPAAGAGAARRSAAAACRCRSPVRPRCETASTTGRRRRRCRSSRTGRHRPAPAALPELAVRVRHHRDRGIRAVVEAAPAAVAVGRVHHAPPARAPAAAGRAARAAAASCAARPATRPRRPRWRTVSGCTNSRIQSSASAAGTVREIGRRVAGTGAPSASANSTPKRAPAPARRGGNTAARVRRWMWNHSPNTSSSGTPRCTKTNSENRRSPTAPTVRKLRASGAARSGSASSHSAVAMAENWPSWSQLSQKPPIALTKAKHASAARRSATRSAESRGSGRCSHSRSRCSGHQQHEGIGRIAVQAAQPAAQRTTAARDSSSIER